MTLYKIFKVVYLPETIFFFFQTNLLRKIVKAVNFNGSWAKYQNINKNTMSYDNKFGWISIGTLFRENRDAAEDEYSSF